MIGSLDDRSHIGDLEVSPTWGTVQLALKQITDVAERVRAAVPGMEWIDIAAWMLYMEAKTGLPDHVKGSINTALLVADRQERAERLLKLRDYTPSEYLTYLERVQGREEGADGNADTHLVWITAEYLGGNLDPDWEVPIPVDDQLAEAILKFVEAPDVES